MRNFNPANYTVSAIIGGVFLVLALVISSAIKIADPWDKAVVSDFILDDANWQIMYLVVDTHNWFDGKKVLVEPRAIKEIQWDNSKVIMNISIEAIKDCAVFDESQFNHSRSASISLVNS